MLTMWSGLIAPKMSNLQDRIDELMKVTGWSVPEVARRAQVTPSAVSQWLGKAGRPTKSILLRPAIYLERDSGFSALWLSSGEGPKFARQPGPSTGIASIFPGISQEKWEALGERQKGVVEERLRQAIDEQFKPAAAPALPDLGNNAGRQTAPPKSARA